MNRKRAVELTNEGSHVAVARGYACGEMIEEGQAVPAGVPVGSWMAPKDAPVPVD